MPIEGPLRELGIHDVFQLLDISRKTGMLRVTSELRDDEGTVYFDGGRVVHADIRSKPSTIEELLVQSGRVREEDLVRAREFQAQLGNGSTTMDVLIQVGALTARDIERLLRQRMESVVFDLMSWREGYFSFEERPISDLPADARVDVATESLLMESARRIDEWSRIADKVPNLSVVPTLAEVSDDHETQLDLLPHEWEVLTMIDGERDLRAISAALGRVEFEVAKIAYGLATTGVIEIKVPRRQSIATPVPSRSASPEVYLYAERGFSAARAGDLEAARLSWEQFLKLAPNDPSAPRVRSALEAANALFEALEALS
jgi:hypothetical protein